MYWYSRIEADSTYWAHVFPPMVVAASGFALMFIPLTLTAVYGVDKHEQGVTSAVLNSMQQVGGALGIAVLSTVWVREMIAFTEGATRAFLVVGMMLLGVAIVVVLGLRIKHEELSTDGETAVA